MNNLQKFEVDDASFVSDLKSSQRTVWRAAQHLNEKGHNVTIRPLKIRPCVEEMNSYSDMGDIEIIQRVEVKKRNDIDFKSVSDFPYPSIIVDVAHTWDNAFPKPIAYMIFNASETGYILVKKNTFNSWKKIEKFDRFKKRKRTFYECPLSLCEFVQC